MGKNYMEQVARMLGVEMNERFRIKDLADHKFYINENGLQCETYEIPVSGYFNDILAGKYEIVKIPKRKHTGLEDVVEGDSIFGVFCRAYLVHSDRPLKPLEFTDRDVRDNWERYISIKKRLAKAASELNTEPFDLNNDEQFKWYIGWSPDNPDRLETDYILRGSEGAIYFTSQKAAERAIEIVGKDDLIWLLRDFQPYLGYSTEVSE